MTESGFAEIQAEDLTRHVEKTWDVGEQILRRPAVRAFLPLMGSQTQQFAMAFNEMRRAYREGAMLYGMFSARKP